jgi:hypothetical protein
MVISRREFLKAGTMAGISAIVPVGVFNAVTAWGDSNVAATAGGDRPDVSSLSRTTFARQLHDRFRILSAASRPVDVKLIGVRDLDVSSGSREQCFSILFRGPRKRPLPQETYMINHREIGTFPLLLVPVGESRTGRFYEAVFNRIPET